MPETEIWTQEQVDNLVAWQTCGHVHPYTCGVDKCRADLVPTRTGWICPIPGCGYVQKWAHDMNLDFRPVNPMDLLRPKSNPE